MVEKKKIMNRNIERSDPDSETSHAIHETENKVVKCASKMEKDNRMVCKFIGKMNRQKNQARETEVDVVEDGRYK